MRYMLIVKADKDSESGVFPPDAKKMFDDMAKFNEEMVKAGVMLAGEGLTPSSQGCRVHYSDERRTVTDGPFTETKELVGGFWILQVKSRDEAVEWAKRVPFTSGQVEVRKVSEPEDFPPELFTEDTAERERALREQLEQQAQNR